MKISFLPHLRGGEGLGTRLSLVLVALLSSCTCSPKPSAEPEPWSTVFHALYDRERQLGFTGPDGGTISVTTQLGIDGPQAFIGEDVSFLRSEEKTSAALKALADALEPDPSQRPIGAVLLQSDLWERFDALEQAIADHDEGAANFRRLLPAIARLMQRLALPREQVDGLEPNQRALVLGFPTLLEGFPAASSGWWELRKERPTADGGVEAFTKHSERQGSRTVFRVFAAVPLPLGGAEWFGAPIASPVRLPENTRLVLLASPLVLTKEGGLTAAPFFTLAELRQVKTAAPPRAPPPFAVLEATRADLMKQPQIAGGFHQLAPDAPIPMGATCLPDLSTRVPLVVSCLGCHADGAQLGGAFFEPGEQVRLEQSRCRRDPFRSVELNRRHAQSVSHSSVCQPLQSQMPFAPQRGLCWRWRRDRAPQS